MKDQKMTLPALLREVVRGIGRAMGYLSPIQQLLHWPTLLIYASQNLVMNYMMGWLMAQAVAAAMARSMAQMGQSLALYGVFFALYMLVLCASVYWLMRNQTYTAVAMIDKAYGRLLAMPLGKMESVGDALSRLENDLPRAAGLTGMDPGSWFMGIIGGVGACFIVAGIHPLLLAGALAASLLGFATEALLVAPNRRLSDRIQKGQSDKTVTLDDMIAGGLTVRLLNLQGDMDRRLGVNLRAIARLTLRQVGHLGMLSALGSGLSQWMTTGGMMAIGLYLASQGIVQLPDVMIAAGMASTVAWMFIGLSSSLKVMQSQMAGARRGFELLDEAVEDGRTEARLQPAGEGTPFFSLEHVDFGYDRAHPVLKDVSLSVERGQTLALVGESGSGKSTLLRLMMNLYLPQGGDVRIQGHSFRDMTLGQWRGMFAYVPQDSPLFDGTVAGNIAMGRQGASREEVIAAAKEAFAHDFIMTLPQGYDTPVGEGATMISGGQRQRIAIARAILRDAPVLLLDEATSSLDTQSEQAVQAALERLMAGRVTVVVAHRLSTIRRADAICLLAEGRVTEVGDHESLLAAGGAYAAMVKAGSLA